MSRQQSTRMQLAIEIFQLCKQLYERYLAGVVDLTSSHSEQKLKHARDVLRGLLESE